MLAEEVPEKGAATASIEIDVASGQVLRDGSTVTLGGRAHALMAALAAQPGRIFSAHELVHAVWPGRIVEMQNLRVQVLQIRKALGRDSIINVPGRGYRLGVPLASAGAATAPTGRPSPTLALVGRSTDIGRIQSLLAPQVLVTLCGPAGVGKSRVAWEVAERTRARYADGVAWVDVAQTASATLLPSCINAALGLQVDAGGSGDLAALTGLALSRRSMLLVLDAVDHLEAGLGSVLHRMLALAPQLCVLVTSTQRLHGPFERPYRLAPIAVSEARTSPRQVRSAPAVHLFEAAARTVEPTFRLSDAAATPAADLCRAIDGSPLAASLLAPLVALDAASGDEGALTAIGRRIADGSGDSALVRALRTVHERLGPVERACLRRVSVIAGAFDLSDAANVAAAGDLSREDALRSLDTLVQIGVLQPALSREARFRLSTSVQALAADALLASGEGSTVRHGHVCAMAAKAEMACSSHWMLSDRAWREQWDADATAWEHAFELACSGAQTEAAASIAQALGMIDTLRGLDRPTPHRVHRLTELLRQAEARPKAVLLDCLQASWTGLSDRLEHARRRVLAWRDADEPRSHPLCCALVDVASMAAQAGDAVTHRQALDEARGLESARWTARERALGPLRAVLASAAASGDANRLFDASKAQRGLLEAGGAWRAAAHAEALMGEASLLAGQHAAAVHHFTHAIRRLQLLRLDVDCGRVHAQSIAAWVALGELRSAAAAASEHMAMAMAAPVVLHEGLEPLALLCLAEGRPDEAAHVIGVSNAHRARSDTPRRAWEEQVAEQVISSAAAILGPGPVAARVAEGHRADLHHTCHQLRQHWRADRRRTVTAS